VVGVVRFVELGVLTLQAHHTLLFVNRDDDEALPVLLVLIIT
jgi:hypothetical protein